MASPFKKGSQPHILNEHFKSGKSLTYDEATAIGVKRLTQRIQDLKNTYLEKTGYCPIMVHKESNKRGGFHTRYFYKGVGSPLETHPNSKMYYVEDKK